MRQSPRELRNTGGSRVFDAEFSKQLFEGKSRKKAFFIQTFFISLDEKNNEYLFIRVHPAGERDQIEISGF